MPENPSYVSDHFENGVQQKFKSRDVTLNAKSKRTRCEKGLLLVVTVFGLAIIALVVVLVITYQNSDNDDGNKPVICTSSDCAQAASRVLDSIDTSVDPCDDFYRFACGAWKRKNVIPEDKSGQKVFGVLRDNVEVINKYLLEDTNSYKDFTGIQKAKDMYMSCTNLKKIEELDLNVSYPLLEELGGWPVLGLNPGGNWEEASFDIVQLLTTLRKYNNRPVFNFYVSSDVKDSEKHIIYMDEPSFGLPGRDYYLKESETYQSMRDAYVKLASGVAVLFGADQATAESDMNKMLELETELANISMKAEDRRDNEALYNKMSVQDLAVHFTEPTSIQFQWLNFVQSLMDIDDVKVTVNASEQVVIRAVPYFKRVFNVLQKYSKREIANYLVWYIMMHRAHNLPHRFRELVAEYNEVVYGTTSERARWRMCVDYTVNHMGMAVGHMFVQETFDESAKDMAFEMISNIRLAFYELLDELDWMDEPTKVLAREKAQAIGEWIGYPSGLLNKTHINQLYENYTVDADKYFENVLGNLKRSASGNLKVLRDKYEKNVWTTPPSTVNAFYNSVLNNIMFPAGILQPPFYSKSQPKSMNYGGIGVVMGHEITHGFDDRGRQYDKEGNLVQWWDESIIQNFKEKAQCIVNQYGNFTVSEANMNVNGINTQGENIADNGGLKQSFRAYRKWVEARGAEEPLLPGIEYNHNQLFFINFGQVWCNNMRQKAMIRKILTDVHSPGEFRVIGTLQNSPDFAAAFNCKKGRYMNPEKKCYVW